VRDASRRREQSLKIVVAAAVLLASHAVSVDAAERALRCGNALIHPGMVAAEITAKCGAPKSKDGEDVPVRVRRPNGRVAVVGTVRVERWTYDRGYGQFPALLTFEEGKLKTIELLTGR
jgi:hypothetical protein